MMCSFPETLDTMRQKFLNEVADWFFFCIHGISPSANYDVSVNLVTRCSVLLTVNGMTDYLLVPSVSEQMEMMVLLKP